MPNRPEKQSAAGNQRPEKPGNTQPGKDSPSSPEETSRDSGERALSPAELELRLAQLGMTSASPMEEEDRLAAPIGYTRKHGGLPATKKSLGQNWLTDGLIAREIVSGLNAGPGDLIVEVGPGGGALTHELLATGADVLAIEIDRRMVDTLHERWPDESRLTIVHADILRADLQDLTGDRPFLLIGNLPYNITSSLLFHLMEFAREHPGRLRRMVVMLQQEVAERITAEPGHSEYSVLSVFLRLWGTPELLLTVPRDKFAPPPKVDAGVVGMEVSSEPLYPLPHWPTFQRLVKGTFSKRRKMLRNSLPGIPHLGTIEGVDFDWTRRPQTLSAEEFAWLAQQLVPRKERNGGGNG